MDSSEAPGPQPWLALAVACLCASLGAQGGRWSTLLDLLAQAAPLWFVGSAVAAVAAMGTRPGLLTMLGLAAGIGLLASGVLIAPELLRPGAARQPAPAAPGLRVIQINLGGSGLRRPEATAAWLCDQHPDLIFVDDPDAAFTAALRRGGFVWTPGTAWTGIASRRPLLRPSVVFSAGDWRSMPDMARARLATRAGSFDLIAVHLTRPFPGRGPRDNRTGVAWLEALTHRYDRRRLILAGDLNLTPWSFGLRRLDRSLGLQRRDRAAFTWPARLFGAAWPLAVLPLDHLYAGPGWRTVRVIVGPPIGATHDPLIVDLAPAD